VRVKRSKKFWLLIGCASVAAFLLLAYYVVGPLIAEDAYVKRGTIAYYITIHSPAIKNFPLIKKAGDEVYYSSAGDGPKLPANGLFYLSLERPEVLSESLDSYLTGNGFDKDGKRCGEGQCIYNGKGSSIELIMTPKESGMQQVKCTEYFLNDR
jgi:hypothetical protein